MITLYYILSCADGDIDRHPGWIVACFRPHILVRPCLNWIIIGPRKWNTVWAAIAIDAHALTCLRSFIRLTSNFTNQDSFA